MILKNAIAMGIFGVVIGSIFIFTNPDNLSPAVFVLVFFLIYGFLTTLLLEVMLLLRHMGFLDWRAQRMARVASMLAAFPVFLIVLKSIGQLTLRDIILSLALFLLAYLYFNRTTSPTT